MTTIHLYIFAYVACYLVAPNASKIEKCNVPDKVKALKFQRPSPFADIKIDHLGFKRKRMKYSYWRFVFHFVIILCSLVLGIDVNFDQNFVEQYPDCGLFEHVRTELSSDKK